MDAVDLLEAAEDVCCVAEDAVEVAAGADAEFEVAAVVCEAEAEVVEVVTEEVNESTGFACETAAESEDVAAAPEDCAVEDCAAAVVRPVVAAGMVTAETLWTLSICIVLPPYMKRTCRISLIGRSSPSVQPAFSKRP